MGSERAAIQGGLSVPRAGVWREGAAFAAAVALLAALDATPAIAVYGLSFWHYLLYAAAYRHGAVPLSAFKRDAVAAKTGALGVLGYAYLGGAPDALSLAVVAAGFGLNIAAAHALGGDRTYYGHELAGLPPLRVTWFPYSLTAHPMLIGNMAAYGGLLLNAPFRAEWWPLACAHVALNVGLLAMETRLRPLRRAPRPWTADSVAVAIGGAALVGALVGALAGTIVVERAGLGAALGALIGAFGASILVSYVPYGRALR